MGVNFFITRNISRSTKTVLKQLVDSESWSALKDSVPEKIHIGKMTPGWQFLWNANDFNHFEPSKQSLRGFLHMGQIEDENGKLYTFDEFLVTISDALYNGMTMESYMKAHPMDSYKYTLRFDTTHLALNHHIYPDKFGEFMVGGLRFTNGFFR